MKRLIFWSSWAKNDRRLATLIFIFFCLSALYLVYGYFYGLSNIISWDVRSDLVSVPLDNLKYEVGPFRIPLPVDQYVVFQYYQGSILNINPAFWGIFMVFLVLSVSLALAIISALPRFWFYGAMGGFIGFVVLIQPDHIQLFGSNDRSASILILSVYLSLGYILREFKPDFSLTKRFLLFLSATLVIGLIVFRYAGVTHPFSYLVSYGIIAPLIVSVAFILTVSHEIIFAFLYLVSGTSRTRSSGRLLHFTLFSLIYLAYVFLTYLHNTRYIDWNLVYLNPILIVFISVVAGFWWLGRREYLYKEILPFSPNAALLFLAFGAMTFSTYGFILSVGNDPLAETFEDVIIFSQLGFGIMFFIYLVANFGQMMSKGYNILDIAYQSRTIPFFVFRLGGLLAAGFLLFQSGFFPFFQAKAGYYNLIGDLFWDQNQTSLAGEYYDKGSQFEFQNHRSNYALASIARMTGNKAEEIYYLENANLKQPSPYAYVNSSNAFLNNDQYFDALFKLEEGYELFPGSSRINNNLGYLYSKTDLYDSAYFFLRRAMMINPRLHEVRANGYALIAKADVHLSYDSIVQELKVPVTEPGLANMTALANDIRRPVSLAGKTERSDTSLSPGRFALMYNSALNSLHYGDTAYFARLSELSDIEPNPFYQTRLKLAASLGFYQCGQIVRSFQMMEGLIVDAYLSTEFQRLLARMYLLRGDPRNARKKYEQVLPLTDSYDRLCYAVSLFGSADFDQAGRIFGELSGSEDPNIQSMAGLFREAVSVKIFEDSINDKIKYLLYRYRIREFPDLSFEKVIHSVSDPRLRDLIRQDEALKYLAKGEFGPAMEILSSTEITDTANIPLNKVKILLAVSTIDSNQVDKNYTSMAPANPYFLEYTLGNALQAERKADTVNAARYFGVLSSWDPYFEEGILAAVKYHNDFLKNPTSAYDILYRALEINSYSVQLNKAFILQCIKLNLASYATSNLQMIRNILSPADLGEFEAQLKAETALAAEKYNEWGGN